AFNRKPVAQRMAIVAAGPIVNLLLAVVLYAAVAMIGVNQIAPILGAPPASSPAAQAGLQAGDVVTDIVVGGQPQTVRSWQDIRWQLIRAAGEPDVGMDVKRNGREAHVQLALDPQATDVTEAWFERLGLRLPEAPALIAKVLPEGAAAAAGLRAGDEVVAVDGRAVASAEPLRALLRQSAGRALNVTVRRDGRALQLTLTPAAKADGKQTVGYVGAMIGAEPPIVMVRLGTLDALRHGMRQTWQMSTLTVKMIGRMLVGEASIKQLSGPLSIAEYAGKSVSLGLTAYLGFLAVISVSLGVLNLLPIPILDGGHLLYYSVEFVRGKALPESWELFGQRVGMVLLAAMMLVAVSNDFLRMLGH
ncbi:MAG: RIP metalloprotease RseP, partial [Betaproteobacteria bacterium]|nr:RIP metalloprotease RseP [Betaproteobacteria bacterium]